MIISKIPTYLQCKCLNEFHTRSNPQVVTSVQTPHTIAIQKRVDAFVRRTAKVSIAINVCQIRMDGNIREVASYAIVITLVRLDNRVTCTPDSACVVKDSLAVSVIDAQPATLDIRTVSGAIVIEMVH